MVTGDDRSALDWLWRWNLGGEGGIIAALAGVSSPKSEGEEKVMSDPSWAQVSGPLAVHAGGSGLSWSGWGMRRGRAARHVLLMAHVSRWRGTCGGSGWLRLPRRWPRRGLLTGCRRPTGSI